LVTRNWKIQVRTSIQHKWAELSEKVSDILDPSIKYGGGDEVTRDWLERTSRLIDSVEWKEKEVAAILAPVPPRDELSKESQHGMDELLEHIRSEKNEITQLLEGMIADLD